MNVMAQAHKMTREALSKLASNVKMTYAAMFKLALKEAHKEYKAMKAQEFTMEQQAGIKHCQDVINAYLDASDTLRGWVQVFPESMMLVNAEVGTIANLKNVPTYARIEDARFWDGRVGNKAGEVCRTMGAQTYISRQIASMEEALRAIKEGK